jgi:hypothetical protein
MTSPTSLETKKLDPMTKNDSYDQTRAGGETNSLSEVARKLGKGFAARARDRDETGSFVAENFGELKAQRFMNSATRRWLFIMPQDWTWWVWLVTACLLLIGVMGPPEAFLAALLLSIVQSVLSFARERAFKAFPLQLRLAYTLLLIICFFPPIRWALLAARCRHLRACHIRILSDGKNAFAPALEPHRNDYGRLAAPNISVPTQTTGSGR